MKKLLNLKRFVLVLCLCAPLLTRGAENISLPISNDSDLGSGWGESTYDGSTQTITYVGTWTGRGWWLGTVDYSDYAGVEIVVKTSLTGTINLVTQYNYYASYDEDGNGEGDALSTSTSFTPSGDADEEQTIYCAFSESMKDDVEQIYIQSADAGEIILVSATIIANENSADVAEEETLDLTGDNAGDWNSGATRTAINDDGSVVLNFPGEWTSFGWTNYWPGWDISEYDAVVLTYEDLVSESGSAYLQLFIGDGNDESNSSTQAGTSAESGTIEYVIASHSGPDYTNIAQIFVQGSAACTATVKSIKFVKYSTGDEENNGDDDETGSESESLDLTGDNTSNWGDADNDKIEVSGTSANLTMTESYGGLGWHNWNGWDLTDYDAVVLTYENLSSDADGTIIQLCVEDGDGYTASVQSTTDSSGTITLVISENGTGYKWTGSSNEPGDMTYSNIQQIIIQSSAACTVTITSITFVKYTTENEGGDGEDGGEGDTADYDLLTDYTGGHSGWNNTADGNTFTIDGEGGGYGWWLGGVDESEYAGIVVAFTATPANGSGAWVQLVAQYYTDGDGHSSDTSDVCSLTMQEGLVQVFYLPVNSAYGDDMEQIYIQAGTDGDKVEILSAKLVRTVDEITVSVATEEGYATYYNSKQYAMPAGLTGVTISGYDESGSGSLTEGTTYTAGTVVPAGTALLIYGEGTDEGIDYTYVAVSDEYESGVQEAGTNHLYGSDEAVTANVGGNTEDYYFYMLSYGADGSEYASTLGFYWAPETMTGGVEGGAFETVANRAWLALPRTESTAKLSGFAFGDGGETTGITAVPAETVKSVSDGVIYNLQGMRVNDMSKKGIYIVDGKKTVKR